jgi:hypothetical protein
VAEVYHGSGTRSQRVIGFAEWCPGTAVSLKLTIFRARACEVCRDVQRAHAHAHTHIQVLLGGRHIREADVLSYSS